MTQNAREALIELLFLSLYLDEHLSLAEDDVLTSALDSLGWESTESREKHVFKSFAAARANYEDAIKCDEFLKSKAAIIKADGEEAAAITWLSKVLGSDGLTFMEKRFLDQLEAQLFPQA